MKVTDIGSRKIYTGIGSRETPQDIQDLMGKIAFRLYVQGYTLRSGAAPGADSAFEYGHDQASKLLQAGCRKEIYLPWKNFGARDTNERGLHYKFPICDEEYASTLVDKIHPAPHNLSYGARKLHIRNCFQVLGCGFRYPSDFLICWTPNAKDIGGTRTAIVLARMNNIPVWNLANKEIEIIIRGLLEM